MLDNQIFINIIAALKAGLLAQSITDVVIKQNFQPVQQGANIGPTLYIHKLGDHRYGWLERTDVWDQDLATIVHTERQLYESMFQITALSIQNPALITQKTASDLANIAAGIMQSDVTRQTLTNQGLNIYRITDIRNPYFVDDKDRFEASPSFDFTLQHEQVIISTTPAVDEFTLDIERV